MAIERGFLGVTPEGKSVQVYRLAGDTGIRASVIDWGACLQSLRVQDGTDVILGFDSLDAYLSQAAYIGSTVGRYANRVAHGSFTLDGKRYRLTCNEGPHHLHGGIRGLDKVLWRDVSDNEEAVTLEHLSPDGEQGYPGNLHVTARFALESDDALRIDYTATSDRPTVVNLTNHAYFNLAGRGDVLQHHLQLLAGRFLPVDNTLIPSGELRDIEGTPMDFRAPVAIGARIRTDDEQLNTVAQRAGYKGYDHNWVLDKSAGTLGCAARVIEPQSGRSMQILTTAPGIQFYSGHLLDGSLIGRGGRSYSRYAGFCLEPQQFPDSPNHPHFPTTALRPGEVYRHTIVYRFGA